METITIDRLQQLLYDVQEQCMYSDNEKLQQIGHEALVIRETLIPQGSEDFLHEITLKWKYDIKIT
jgi:hypothetical protein